MNGRLLLMQAVIGWLCASSAVAAPPITAAACTPDGKHVLIGSQAGIEVRSWPELKITSQLKTDLAHVHDLAFSPDGTQLLVAGGSPGEQGIVDVLNWPSRDRVRRVAEHTDLVYRVAWSPDGSQWATAAADGICRVFDTQTGKQRIHYAGHSRAVLAIAYLPAGKLIISAGVDQTLQLWESSTGKQLRSLDNHLASVNDLAVRPGGLPDAPPVVVSVSDDRTVRFWQPTIGRLMRFARLPSPPRAVGWSADGKQILVGCTDGKARRIDSETIEVSEMQPRAQGRIHVLLAAPKSQIEHWLIGGEAGVLKLQESEVMGE